MTYAIQWVRSLVFNIIMYVLLLPWGIVFFIPAIFSRKAAIYCCRSYCWFILWLASWMIGLKCDVRGTPPQDEVVIAAKHQSFLDVLMIYSGIPAGRFIMKDILKYAPVLFPGQLIIYPQGTRIAPGVKASYKIGTGVLYKELNQDCVPVAANVGVFWPKRGVYRAPGTAVVEFLPRIPAGLPIDEFMAQLETAIETRSNQLMREAGFTAIET